MSIVRRLRASAPQVAAASLLAACSSTPLPPDPAPRAPVATAPAAAPSHTSKMAQAPAMTAPVMISHASTPRDYRADAAAHIYKMNAERIYKGKMPPLLHAVGVVQVEVDGHGMVKGIHWMRAPSHAPEVVAEIERLVRAAEPFPVPARMGHVTYTDTWLWHKSGRFQLDTLTEGQL